MVNLKLGGTTYMKLLIAALSLLATFSSWACQIQIGTDFQRYNKNMLITAVAQEFKISLVQASQMQVTGYTYRLHGTVPGSSCEAFLEHKARVTIKYQPSLIQRCELSVDVELQEDMHAETMPYQTFTYTNPASSCVRVRPIIRIP
jgi:hypothetical protein